MKNATKIEKNKYYFLGEDHNEPIGKWPWEDDEINVFRPLRDFSIEDQVDLDATTANGICHFSVQQLTLALFKSRVFEISEDEYKIRNIK